MPYSERDLFDISGDVAIVTGAAGGIGSELSLALAELGTKVVLTDIAAQKLDEIVQKITTLGYEACSIVADVTDKKSVESMMQRVYEKYGKIDILINAAGICYLQDAIDFEEDKWEKVIAVNLKGTLLTCQAAGRYMLQQNKGRIVNFSSVRGIQGRARDLAYAPSKGAVDQLTRSLAIEWAKMNINVNAIAPAFTLTEINKDFLNDSKAMDWVISRLPKGMLGQPGYLTGPTVFLCSKASEFITGQILYVDGGWTCA